MDINFRYIILILFLTLSAWGAFLLVEKSMEMEIDTTPSEESRIIESETVIMDTPAFKKEEQESTETDTESFEFEIESISSDSTETTEVALPLAKETTSGESVRDQTTTTTPTISFSDINIKTRAAVVNILCTTKSTGAFKPISGSGVIIDERGIILTNAHIAQYFLLEDYQTDDFVSCTIRTGSPAKPTYHAELLHISPEWIRKNVNNVVEEAPKGTGENDFALLRITEHVIDGKTLPETFPFIEVTTEDSFISKNINVLLAGYSAGFLGGIAIQKDLYMTSTITQIAEVYTFATTTIDLFSIGGSIVAQAGSSGGAVVDSQNRLLGIIVTSSQADTTDERDLRALSLPHINRSLIQNNDTPLAELLSGDLETKATIFNDDVAQQLKALLTDVLDK